MSSRKATIYKIENNSNYKNSDSSTNFIVGIVVYAIVLMITSSLFEAFHVENILYACIAAIILNILDSTIKPLLIVLTLPLNLLTLGITYPIVNVILLKLCDWLMGSTFNLSGFFAPFIISLFISGMKIILDNFITKKVGN